MNVGELIALLTVLPDDMPVAINTNRRGMFGTYHIEYIGIDQRREWPASVTAACPECGHSHRHASRHDINVEPKHVKLGVTISPVSVLEGVTAPDFKVYGRWPGRAALRRAGIVQ